MSDTQYDVAVIGAGPGGYVAAIRAAQYGLKTVVIEKENIGGECLNHGCIPSKALIHAAEAFAELGNLKTYGITVEGAKIDLATAVAWKDKVVKRLTGGIGLLFKANGVTAIEGTARFVDSNTLQVTTAAGEQTISAKNTIVAVGAKAIEVPGLPFDGKVVISSREALALTEIPPRMVVIGGGYIGLELGIVYAKLGTAVTVVELTDGLLPGSPRDAVKVVERGLRRAKIKTLLKTKAVGLAIENGVAKLTVAGPDGIEQTIEAEKILVTVGRKAAIADLGLENTKVERNEKGAIKIDARRRTTDPQIFAIGDVAEPPLLAHKASAEALVAAAVIAGKPAEFTAKGIAAVVFTDPEIATVGLSLETARQQGIEADEAIFPFLALGRALTMNSSDGHIKWIYALPDHTVLGCEIVGREASNLIGEAALAVEKKLTLHHVAETIHPHPTLTEGLSEAAEVGLGLPIHVPKK